jgi:hypothetical protein
MTSHARKRYVACEDCKTPGTVGVELSNRGLCESCAIDRMTKSARQLKAKEGPYYAQWCKSTIEAARRLVDSGELG